MNTSRLLIFVSAVTLLSACGSKKSSQPTMVGKKDTVKVERSEDGNVALSGGQCQAVEADSAKVFCEKLRDLILAEDPCKKTFGYTFKSESCAAQVDTVNIQGYLDSLSIDDSGVATAVEDNKKELKVVEVNPDEKSLQVTTGEVSIISVDLETDNQNDGPVASTEPVQEAVDQANDAAATAVVEDNVDLAHVVFIPELSDRLNQVQVQSQPAVQVSTVENTETRKIETRFEDINDNRVQLVAQRDPSLSLLEDAKNQCRTLFKKLKRFPHTKDINKCARNATTQIVEVN